MLTIPELNNSLCRALGVDPANVSRLTLTLEPDEAPTVEVVLFVDSERPAKEIATLELVAREPAASTDVSRLGSEQKLWSRAPIGARGVGIDVAISTGTEVAG